MSLSIALQNAVSALQTSTKALDITTQNVANVNTEGYSRKIVNQQSVSVGGQGAGVSIASITRAGNEFLSKELRATTADLNDKIVRNDFFGRMQDLFGSLSSDSTLSTGINDLAIVFQALSDTPEDVAMHTDLVEKAKLLTRQINDLATKIEALRLEVDKDIALSVSEINTSLTQIEDLNLKIAENSVYGLGTAELEDKREMELAKIAKHIDIKTFERATGEVVVFTSRGRMLLDRSASLLTHTAAVAFDPGITLAGGGIGGIMMNGTDITAEITSGRIAGLVEMRDMTLPNLHSQIQELTTALHDEINLLHNQGSAYPGLPSMTGTRTVAATDTPIWTGTARFTMLDTAGVVVETVDINLAGIANINALVAAVAAGLPSATASINATGKFSITVPSTNRLAINEMTSAVTVGNDTMGVSAFLGLNDLFSSSRDYDDYRTNYQTSATTALGLAGTLTFRHGATSTNINYIAGDSLTDVAATINADAGLIAQNITASIVPDGSGYRLRITDTDGNNFFISDNSTLVSSQNLKARDTGITAQIAVRSDIVNDPSRITRGQLASGALVPGDIGLTPGDKTNVQNISNRFNASIDFAATGLLAATRTSLAQYATEILSLNATQANATASSLQSREVLMENLKNRIGEISGVNLDEEMSRLIILENAYAAAARIINVTQEMFDLLNKLV